MIRYFKKVLKGKGDVIAIDQHANACALQAADVGLQAPGVHDTNYLPFVKKVIREYDIKAILSLNDHELPVLANARESLEALGAKVLCSNPDIIEMCFDKWATYQFFQNNQIGTPRSYISLADVKKALQKGILTYPVILKPRWGSASSGITLVEDEKELDYAYYLLDKKLQKSVESKRYLAEPGHGILLQEYISGVEYGLDILNDLQGNHYASFGRQKLAMRAGETDLAISVINPEFSGLGKKIGELTGHYGIIDSDLMEKDGRIYFLELNPRFGGGYPFSHEAGVNVPAMYLAWLEGRSNVAVFNRYKAGVAASKYQSMMPVLTSFITETKPILFTKSS